MRVRETALWESEARFESPAVPTVGGRNGHLPERTLDVEALISQRLGIVNRLVRLPALPGLPPLVRYVATRKAHRDHRGRVRIPPLTDGIGFGWEPERARWAAIGEAVERYAAAVPPPAARLRRADAPELGPSTLNLGTLGAFSARQYAQQEFPFRRPDPETKRWWVQGWSLTRWEPRWVPAACVYQPFDLDPPEEWIREPISTGLAAGSDLWGAVLAGLLECVERDGFILAYLSKGSPTRVLATMPGGSWEADGPWAGREGLFALGWCRACGVDARVYDLTTDYGVPTALAVLRRPGQLPALACGAAARLDPAEAAGSALREALGTFLSLADYLFREREEHPVPEEPGGQGPMIDDPLYYAAHPEQDPLGFLEGSGAGSRATARAVSGERPDLGQGQPGPYPPGPPGILPGGSRLSQASSAEAQVGEVVRRLEQAGAEAVYVDLTPSDLREVGLHVVRVIVPEAQFMHHHVPLLGNPRLYRVPQARGWRATAIAEEEANLQPHPFP